jgi:hypothetical protein
MFDRRTPDFSITQNNINDFYNNYMAAFFQGRQQEVKDTFKRDFNLTDDQLDYIVRRIDTNPIRRQRGFLADEESRQRREAQAVEESDIQRNIRARQALNRSSAYPYQRYNKLPDPNVSRGAGVGNIFRRVRPDRIYMADDEDATMTNAEDERLDILARDRAAMNMADNGEFDGADLANLMANIDFEDVANRDADISEVSYSDPDSDENNPINYLGYYTPSSSDSSLSYELGNTPRPRGGNRMCRCCQRPICDCYTMSDFNVLHSR